VGCARDQGLRRWLGEHVALWAAHRGQAAMERRGRSLANDHPRINARTNHQNTRHSPPSQMTRACDVGWGNTWPFGPLITAGP